MKVRKGAFWLKAVLPGVAICALVVGGPSGRAAGVFTNGVCVAGSTGPQPSCNNSNTLPLTGVEQLPADTELPGGQSPQSEAITTGQLAGYAGSLPTKTNVLIGGDATSNLFQRATTGSSVTTTVTYGGPDRWAYWSGLNTAMTLSRDSTAGDLTPGYQYAFKLARTAAQTGVVQVCMAQEIESANSYQFAGATAELDFHAFTGANFSGNAANMTAYIITGTGTDEGMQKLAFGLNAGGGGSTAWTGQANATAAVVNLGAVSTLGRYAAVAAIPTGTTEIGVALCWTPVGTAGTNDYLAFSGVQLTRNGSLVGNASTTAGYVCAANTSSTSVPIQCSSFDRSRQAAMEASLQYRYFYQVNEGAATTVRAMCSATTANTTAACPIAFPVVMRIAPTLTATAGFALETTTVQTALNNNTALALSTLVTGNACNTLSCLVQASNATGSTFAVGLALPLYDNGGAGVMKFSSEF